MSSPRRFPASPALGSSDSAEARAPLFAGLTATMAESDCFTAYISGVRLLPSRCGPPCSDRSKTRPLIGLKLGHSRAWPTLVSAGAGRGWEEGDARSAGHLRAAAQGLRRGQEPAPGGARDGARARHGAALPRDAAAGATEAQAAAAGAGAGAAAAGAVGRGVVGAHHGEAAHHGPEAAAGAARGGLRGRHHAGARVPARVAPPARRSLRAARPPPGRERADRLLRGQRRALRRAAQGLALPDAADALGAGLRPALRAPGPARLPRRPRAGLRPLRRGAPAHGLRQPRSGGAAGAVPAPRPDRALRGARQPLRRRALLRAPRRGARQGRRGVPRQGRAAAGAHADPPRRLAA